MTLHFTLLAEQNVKTCNVDIDVMSANSSGQLIRPTRLSDAVVRNLIDSIVSDTLAEGDLLPTESELIERYGVSRTVIRDALQLLDQKGVISVRHGRRTAVQDRSEWNILDPDVLKIELESDNGMEVLEEITQVRLTLECAAAERAAIRITTSQLHVLDVCVEQMWTATELPEKFLDSDITFHQTIAAASGNRIARGIMKSLHGPLRQIIRMAPKIPGGLEQANEYHQSVLEQLRMGDPRGARDAMKEHLDWTHDIWRFVLERPAIASGK